MRETGNKRTETIRQAIEDPMLMFVESKTQARQEKYARVEHLKVRNLIARHNDLCMECSILSYGVFCA